MSSSSRRTSFWKLSTKLCMGLSSWRSHEKCHRKFSMSSPGCGHRTSMHDKTSPVLLLWSRCKARQLTKPPLCWQRGLTASVQRHFIMDYSELHRIQREHDFLSTTILEADLHWGRLLANRLFINPIPEPFWGRVSLLINAGPAIIRSRAVCVSRK